MSLDEILKETVNHIVGALLEDGELHSGEDRGSFVDLAEYPNALEDRIGDISEHVLLCLQSSPLVAEVSRLRVALGAVWEAMPELQVDLIADDIADLAEGCREVARNARTLEDGVS